MFKWLNKILREKVMTWLTAADSVLDRFFSTFKEDQPQKFEGNPYAQQEWESEAQHATRIDFHNTLSHLAAHACGQARYPKPSDFKVDNDLFKALRRSQKAHFLLSVGAEIADPDKGPAPPYGSKIKRRVCDIEFKEFDMDASDNLDDAERIESTNSNCENLLAGVPENTSSKKVLKRLAFFAIRPDGKCGDYCVGSWSREETRKLILSDNGNDIGLLFLVISSALQASDSGEGEAINRRRRQEVRDFFDPNHKDGDLGRLLEDGPPCYYKDVMGFIIDPYLKNKPETLKKFLETFFTEDLWLGSRLMLRLSTLKGIPANEIDNDIFNEIREHPGEKKALQYRIDPMLTNNGKEVLNQRRCVHYVLHAGGIKHQGHFTRLVNVEDHKGLIEAKILENHLKLSKTQAEYDQYMETWVGIPPVRRM